LLARESATSGKFKWLLCKKTKASIKNLKSLFCAHASRQKIQPVTMKSLGALAFAVQVFHLLLSNEGAWRPIFSSTLLAEPRMVCLPNFIKIDQAVSPPRQVDFAAKHT